MRIKYILVITIICLFCTKNESAGQEANIPDPGNLTFVRPRPYKLFEVKTAFSLLFTHLPIDWVETSIDMPVAQLASCMGLSSGFTLNGNIQSVYVANQIRLGPRWNGEWGRFSTGVGVDGAFMFGKMTVSGFDNRSAGWSAYPCASIGYRAGDFAFTLAAELNVLLSLRITSGSAEIARGRNYVSGRSLAFYVEQRLWKNHVMILGLVNNFQKFYYLAWPAFSTFNRQYYIPQFYMGLVL